MFMGLRKKAIHLHYLRKSWSKRFKNGDLAISKFLM